ncbi:hypothetical protein AB0J43_02705 [Nonomuraea fuscirosea]
MSIDTLPAHDVQVLAPQQLTGEVRDFLVSGLKDVNASIKRTEERLTVLLTSQAQLVGMLGGSVPAELLDDKDREPAVPPTPLCRCRRIGITHPVYGFVHEIDGQHVPAGDVCVLPKLDEMGGPARASVEGPIA